MGKYDHTFIQTENLKGCVRYQCDGTRVQLDFLERDILRVAILPEGCLSLPTYSVCPDGKMPREGRDRLSTAGFSVIDARTPEENRFRLGDISLKVDPHNLRLEFRKADALLFADRLPLAYNFSGELGSGQYHYLSREPGEHIFGLGDKGGSVDKAGRAFRIECLDAMGYDAQTTDVLYKHVPFYICSNQAGAYGLFYDTHAVCGFDFGNEISNYYGPYKHFHSEDPALVYYVFFGSVRQIVERFHWLCGGTYLTPRKYLLYSGSTMSYTDAPNTDALLRRFVDICEEKGFECGSFHLSSGYTSIGEKRYVFHWNYEKIPDPKALVEYFARQGMTLIANIKPAFLKDHPLYPELARRGYFLKYPDGSPALSMFWDGLGSYLDFTNPDAYDFWVDMVGKELLSKGIAAIWNDNNEYEVTDPEVLACCFGAPKPARLMRPAFTMLMAMASADAQRAYSRMRQHLISRSGGAGITRLCQTWSGDNLTAFKTLRFNHKMGMTMSLSGIYNFGHDVGGFAGKTPSRELFLRWLQYGVLMPRFVIHSYNEDGTVNAPWMYPEAEPAVRALFALRRRLIPHLYNAMYQAHTRNLPVVYPLFLDHPDADVESDCFMIAGGLLAACVFDPGCDRVSVDLPDHNGGWYRDSEHYPPGHWEIKNQETDLPVLFHRAGSVFAEDISAYGSREAQKLRFTVFAIPAGTFSYDFFTDDGESFAYLENDCVRLHMEVICDTGRVTVCYANRGGRMLTPDIRLQDVQGRTLEIREAD